MDKFTDIFYDFNTKIAYKYGSLPRAIGILLTPAYLVFSILVMLVAIIWSIVLLTYGHITCGLSLKEYREAVCDGFREGFNEARIKDSKA